MDKSEFEVLLGRSQKQLSAIGSLFHTMNSEFCFYFGSRDEHSGSRGFESLQLFSNLTAAYRDQRWAVANIDDWIAKSDSLAELDNQSEKSWRKLTDWLREMRALDQGDDTGHEGYSTWQSVTKSFLAFNGSESKFLDAANQFVSSPIALPTSPSVSPPSSMMR